MAFKKAVDTKVTVAPIDMRSASFKLEGTSPLGVARFSQKALLEIQGKQEAGSTSKAKKEKTARDFDADYENSKYVSEDGWLGVNASCFRNGTISVSKICGLVMTRVKLAAFVIADGQDKLDGTPLVRVYGEPQKWIAPVRNADGSFDLRSRCRWPKWKMRVLMEYDAGVITISDLTNLMVRLGRQAGICEGRPDSKKGPGIGMGLFRLVDRLGIPELDEEPGQMPVAA